SGREFAVVDGGGGAHDSALGRTVDSRVNVRVHEERVAPVAVEPVVGAVGDVDEAEGSGAVVPVGNVPLLRVAAVGGEHARLCLAVGELVLAVAHGKLAADAGGRAADGVAGIVLVGVDGQELPSVVSVAAG